MKREVKEALIEEIKTYIQSYSHFYLTDAADLNAQEVSELRRKCFKEDIKMVVVKNTLFKLAMERAGMELEEIYPYLKNNTTVFFTNTASAPGKLIKDFTQKREKPLLKAAFAEESLYFGAEQLDVLVNIKSKDELIADVIMLLQSPMKTVLGQLNSGKNIIGGVVKTLSERDN
ncbi:MAG: 50S ribosomal protein L10 [Bacteroidales bacterium]|nr:50S ribosomal protein L10 [Bacteroidales bacterium]